MCDVCTQCGTGHVIAIPIGDRMDRRLPCAPRSAQSLVFPLTPGSPTLALPGVIVAACGGRTDTTRLELMPKCAANPGRLMSAPSLGYSAERPRALGQNPVGTQWRLRRTWRESDCGCGDGHAERGGFPHEINLRRGQGVSLDDEVAEPAFQGAGCRHCQNWCPS